MTTRYRRPVDGDALAHNFRVFAEADCVHEPLYATLSRAIADDDATVALTMQAPYAQRRPVLLFASVHDLLLAGARHPLAAFYRSVVGDAHCRHDIEHASPAFIDFCHVHRDAIADSLATRATQTNEIGRSAGLRLALATLDGSTPIALIDVGCSGGLNLLVDRYRFAYRSAGGDESIVGPESDVVVATDVVSGRPDVTHPIPPIARRIGIDRAPLDAKNERDARWLRACVWPGDAARHARLAAGLALARTTSLDIRRGEADILVDVLADLDRDVRPVVFHSWVVSYFDGDARRRFVETVRSMVVERDGAWISAEGPNVVPGLAAPPLPDDADAARREATVWHVTTRRDGGAATRAIARSHPHCRWIEWLA